jgi:RHS repeat-associated protein
MLRNFSRKHRRTRFRTTLLEQLEPRLVMSSDGPSPWQNPARPIDINNDTTVSPIDALVLINRINSDGGGVLPPRTRALDPYLDPDGDRVLSPLDILQVINEVNRRGASGSTRNPNESEIAPAGFLSMPLTHLAGSPGQITQLNAQMTIGRVEFNEMGVYVVDDELGSVAGLLPSQAGYADAVFQQSQRRVLFSRQDVLRLTHQVDLPSGQFLRIYVLQSASDNDDPAKHIRVDATASSRMRVGWEEHVSVFSGWQQIGDRGFDDAIVDLFFGQPLDRNSAPVIPSLPDLERPELTSIAFDATAFDPDLPIDRITYSLDQAPPGAIIDPITGLFQWTPTETDGPGAFSVVIRATDRDGLIDTESVMIRVLEVNSPPVLLAFPDVQLKPGERFTAMAQATDPDRPSNTLTFALATGSPSGLTINSANGELLYTAPSDIRQAEYPVTVIVRDDGVPTMQDSRSFRIRVVADRVPPTIASIPDQLIDEMVPWSYVVSVSDLDMPDDSVALSIDRGAAGLFLDTNTSTLRWTPSEEQGPAIYPVTLLATDRDGRTATRSFSIQVREVNRPPVLSPIGSFRINSGRNVSFIPSASDPDLPANTLRYTVVGTPPPGAIVDPVTGRFTWTSPVNAPDSSYSFALQVTDTGNPPLSDVQSVSIQVTQGPIVLVEGDRFLTSHEFPFVLQDGTTHLRLAYENLQFDISDPDSMKDAFELAILDSEGRPVAGVTASNSDGTANRTELQPALIASGTTNQPDSASSGRWTVDVSHLPTGFVGTIVVRLVNNDSDNATQVSILPQLEQLVAPEAITRNRVIAVRELAPTRDTPSRVYTEQDWLHLTDVTPSITIAYDATLYDTNTRRIQAGLTLTNRGSFPFHGPLLVAVSDLSLANVRVANFAGYLPSQSDRFQDAAIVSLRGSPYLDLTSPQGLKPGESTRFLLDFENDSVITSNERFAYRITVLGSLNRAPLFTTTPPPAARPDKQYIYPSVAIDPDRDSVRYALISGPPGLSIQPETGIVAWTPTRFDVGSHSVTIQAIDPLQAIATQTFSIIVPNSNSINRPPIWISSPVVDAYVGNPYQYDGQASDPDDDALTYSLVSGPTGLNIDSLRGDVFWTPTASNFGRTHSVVLQVSDGRGGNATQEFNIYVHPNPNNQPPVFVTAPRESLLVPRMNLGSPQGPVTPDRIEEVIADGESVSRDVSVVLPPDKLVTTTDVVLIVDESGSMREHSWIERMIRSLDQSLVERGLVDNRFAVIGYGNVLVAPRILLAPGDSDPWATADMASQRAAYLQANGDTEDGYLGIEFALDLLEFRANASRQAILVTDEDRDVVGTHLTFETIRVALDQNDVDLHTVSDFEVSIPLLEPGVTPFGFYRNNESLPPFYIVYSGLDNGGFRSLSVPEVELSDSSTTIEDYVDLSTAVGGSSWTIPSVRDASQSTLSSFTKAFVSTLSSVASQGSRVRVRPTIANAPISVGPMSLQGQRVNFPVTFQSLGDTWSFQLEFYDPQTPNIVFGSIPVAIATGYRYDFLAIDPDNDPVEYRLVDGSQHGARIDASQRALIWNPKKAGRYRFSIEATDPLGGIDTQTWTVDAINPIGVNQAPVLNPIPNASMEFGRMAELQLSAFDPDDDSISYQLLLGESTGAMPPTGVQLNPVTGKLQWLPTANQIGRHEITVQVVDGRGGRSKRSFFIDVVESTLARNHSPVFLSQPITAAVAGIDYIYPAVAQDPDQHAIRYTVATGPKGMAIDPTTGIVVWHPTEEQLGIHQIILQATDSAGGRTSQYFQIDVLAINEPPVFTSEPTELVATHQRWLYPITASDPNGDSIAFSLVTAPEGAVIDARNRLDWTPTTNGAYRFVIQADDGRGGLAAQSFTLVAQTNAPPSIDSKPDTFTVLGNEYQYAIVVSDPDPSDRITLTLDSESIARGMSLQNTLTENRFLLSWNPSLVGIYPLTLTASDPAGLTQTQFYSLEVVAASVQNDPPEITSIPTGPAVRNSPWTYRITTFDRNDDAVTVTLAPKTLALGVSIDSEGVASWTPQRAGTFPFTIIATDSRGAVATQSFDLLVLENALPVITSRPTNQVAVNTPYTYDIDANDPNTNDLLRFDLIQFRKLAGANPPTSQPTVNATSGLLAWTPDAPGLYELIVATSDDSGDSDRQSFQLQVTDAINTAPTITNQPRSKIQVAQRYTHQFTASDPDGDRLTFDKIDGPEEVSIDQQGLLQWIPSQVTPVNTPATVTVRVRDPRGGSETRSFAIHVIHELRNSSPRIESTAPTQAIANRPYTYPVIARDADGDNLVYRIADSNNPNRVPRGLTIDPSSGLVQWTPLISQVGEYPLTITVFDPYGARDTQSFVLKVTGTNAGPRITSVPKPETAVNQPYVYAVTAVDDDGDPIRFSIDPSSIVGNMAIDPNTGRLTWTPTSLGTFRIGVRATDPTGIGTQQLFDLRVSNSGTTASNQPPQITTVPSLVAFAGSTYVYDIDAFDPEGKSLTFSITQPTTLPAGATFDPQTGLLRWTPGEASIGSSISFRALATDPEGLTSTQQWSVGVRPANQPPKILSSPITTGTIGGIYQYDLKASDADGDPLTYETKIAPNGLSIDRAGRIRWLLEGQQPGDYPITVTVSDGIAPAAEQSYVLTLSRDTEKPSVRIAPDRNIARVGETLPITLITRDNVAIAARTLTLQSRKIGATINTVNIPLALDADGTTRLKIEPGVLGPGVDLFGTWTFIASATDQAGNVADAIPATVVIPNDSDVRPPIVNILNPNQITVTEPIDILATVNDDIPDGLQWNLRLTSNTGRDVRSLASGTAQLTQARIHRFDPTLLENGEYTLTFTAQDSGGNVTSDSISVTVDGGLKLGNFSVAFQDITVPVSGLPITVTRRYDTLAANSLGEFGYGWKLELSNTKIKVQMDPGRMPDLSGYQPFRDGDRVIVTLPDGTQEGFTFYGKPSQVLFGIPLFYSPAFVPDRGIKSELIVNSIDLKKVDEDYLDYGSGRLYNPADRTFGGSYLMRLRNGNELAINATTGDLGSITDRNGNVLTFTNYGIESNSGRGIRFERDSWNRIVSITDPKNKRVTYEYDNQGNLAAFTDRTGAATRFRYLTGNNAPPHYLDSIVDSLGRPVVSNRYDENGRIKSITNALGDTVNTIFDPETKTQRMTNAIGATMTQTLDGRGNVLREIDPVGNLQLRTFDARDRLLSQTQVIGLEDSPSNGETNDLKTVNQYDANGNPTRSTDIYGHATITTFGEFGEPTASIDILGNVTSNQFDPYTGNLIRTLDPFGSSSAFRYNDRGNVTSTSNTDGTVMFNGTYNKFGEITSITPTAGRATKIEYNLDGDRTASWYFDGTGDNQVQVLQVTRYDDERRAIGSFQAVLPAGKFITENIASSTIPQQYIHFQTTTIHSATGQVVRTVDADGLANETLYDVRGLAIQTRSESRDETGNSVWNLTRTIYDAAGRTIFATRSYREGTPIADIYGTHTVYDLSDRAIASREVRGLDIVLESFAPSGANPTEPQFISKLNPANPNAAGSLVSESTTTYVPNAHGRVASSTDSYGRVSVQHYDKFGNVLQTRTRTYDENNNPMWLVQRNVFDNFGRIQYATDTYVVPDNDSPIAPAPSAPARTVYGTRSLYDAAGRSIGSQRVLGAVVTMSQQGPGPQAVYSSRLSDPGTVVSSTKTEYDNQGRAFKHTAADGQTNITLYDARGRSQATLGHAVEPALVGLSGPDYTNRLVRLRTETVYDDVGLASESITNIMQIEERNGTVFKIDRSQQRVVKQIYDAQNRVIETIHPDGTSNRSLYDERGRVIAEIDPMGHRKDFSFDSSGRLSQVQLPAVPNPRNNDALERPTYQYRYNSFGQMSQLIDAHGRITNFHFDALGRSTGRTLPMGQTETTVYDSRGRQVLHVTFEGVYVSMVYDDSATGGGRLSETQFFDNAVAYNNGSGTPTERLVVSYDAFGKIVQQQHIRPTVTDTYTTAYDSQGRVTQETTPTGTIQYQYDLLGRKTQCRTVVSTVSDPPFGVVPTNVLTEITYTYDLLGRLATVNTVRRDGALVDSDDSLPGNQPESTIYHYDLLGRMDYVEKPNSMVEDYTFDIMDRLDMLRYFESDSDNADLSDNAPKGLFDYSYRADGKRVGVTEKFGDGWGFDSGRWIYHGSVRNTYTWSYDNAGRLISEVLDSSNGSIDQTETYVYDLVGNRMRKEVNKPATAYVDQIFAYNYDANDRITSETLDNGVNGAGVDQTTTYGWNGTQQATRSVSEGSITRSVQSMSYGLSGQLERVVTTTQNGSGVVTGRTRVDYRYTPQGIRTISVDWNDANLDGTFAAGERTGSVEYLIENSNFTGYQQTILETVKNAAGQATKRTSYTFGTDEITQTVSQIDSSSQLITQSSTLTFAHDGKGSVRALFGAGAAIAQVFTYSAYGDLLAIHNGSGTLQPLASSLTSVLYNGEGFDARTGLYNMRARWYSPSTARWERLDPFNGNPNDPFSFHKYNFTTSRDPVQFVDPTGMVEGLIGTLAGIGMRVGMASLRVGLVYNGFTSAVRFEGITKPLARLTPQQRADALKYSRLSVAAYESSQGNGNLQVVLNDGWEIERKYEEENIGYHAILFHHRVTGERVMSYAGTDDFPDVITDIWQGLFSGTTQYHRAVTDSLDAKARFGPIDHFTGHSLGGGLASLAALANRKRATTFNAAGLHTWTAGAYGINLERAETTIDAFRVQGEFLSTIQDASAAYMAANLLPGYTALGIALLGLAGGMTPDGVGLAHWLPPTSISIWDRHKMLTDVIPGIMRV